MNLSREFFFDLERRLKAAGLDSDSKTFDEIKSELRNRRVLPPDEFAEMCAYVILAGGFSQKTAKQKHAEIVKYLKKAGVSANIDGLLQIFNNKNKMAAILKIWRDADKFCGEYYKLNGLDDKLAYLSSLPHIGKITANHLARNLGENVVKYDIWIQRLGAAFANAPNLKPKIDNGRLDPDVKKACDDMFAHLERETGLPRGYIDVVLWKACQNHLLQGV